MKELLIAKAYEDAKEPVRAYDTDAGLDVFVHHFIRQRHAYTLVGSKMNDNERVEEYSIEKEEVELLPGGRILVSTGIMATYGLGSEIQVRPRGGLAEAHGLTVLNAPGTVDEQYRGEILVIIINTSNQRYKLKKGDKFAQIVIKEVILCKTKLVSKEELSSTERGDGCLNSTGN